MRTPPNERLTSDIAEPVLSAAAGSERRCILAGESAPRDGLVRLAISPDGLVLPDVAAKAPGRGAWIGVDRSALETALAEGHLRKALMRAFKGAPLTIPDDLPDRVQAALVRHLCDRLGLELRSGNIVMGSARIEEQARSGRIAILLHASDSSEDGRRKLDQAWRVGTDAEGSGLRGQTLPLDRTALSVALGRDNVVHLGVAGHPGDMRAADRVLQAVSRLVQYAGGDRASETKETGRDTSGDTDQPHGRSAIIDEYVKD
ncbi:DUF448 domain-containing protein [Porphyrobacter sp. TH134]|uniref:DUF448 domain-containing protein n=1 Tax=Porphyrobacter sp. TH134 TaxID=2067450 RepID=UPI000C798920|nr:DUF448 domain-containing protein [Porphyrobacter sp. TH134]PLK24530.1 DUF448 domain-containing protein [Porphyrobacter sp. TH134]